MTGHGHEIVKACPNEKCLATRDLPTPGKGKSGDSTKNNEILFFSRSNPFSIEGTRHQSHFQGLLFTMANGRRRKK